MAVFDGWDQLHMRREYAQLLRLHERLRIQLQHVRDELVAQPTVELIRDVRRRTSVAPQFEEVTAAVEEALRALKLCQAELRSAVALGPEDARIDEIDNLPPQLQRFLAERQAMPGFQYEVLHDPVRGWIIRWKEYTADGTVRGFGQIHERPYAWINQ